jgi:peroxiredoxin
LTILLMMGVYFFFGKSVEQGGSRPKVHWAVLALLVVIPAAFAADYGGQLPKHDYTVAEESLVLLQRMVDQANMTDGDILFVTERHLITFGYLENVELTHDYEKMILMEMAMSGNPVYLGQFAEDMKNQRFSLIVHDGLPQRYKDKDEYSLAEENNVYYERVTPWFLCAYKLAFRIQELGINVYIPKANPSCDW